MHWELVHELVDGERLMVLVDGRRDMVDGRWSMVLLLGLSVFAPTRGGEAEGASLETRRVDGRAIVH